MPSDSLSVIHRGCHIFLLNVKINSVPQSRFLMVVRIFSVQSVCPILRTVCTIWILSSCIRSILLLLFHLYLPGFLLQLVFSVVLTFKKFVYSLQSGEVYFTFSNIDVLLFLSSSLAITQHILKTVSVPMYPKTVSKRSWWYWPRHFQDVQNKMSVLLHSDVDI